MASSSISYGDPVLDDLVKAGNYKQAVKNLDKKLKKLPNDSRLLTLKAHASRTFDLPTSIAICKTLLAAKPPVSKLEDLRALHILLCDLITKQDEIQTQHVKELWQRALDTRNSKDAKIGLAKEWVDTSIQCSDWSSVQTASVSLQRLVGPGTELYRKYIMWDFIANCAAAHVLPRKAAADQIRRLATGKLAMIAKKAFENCSSNFEALSRWVRTHQEALLVANALDVLGDVNHSLAFFQPQNINSPKPSFPLERHQWVWMSQRACYQGIHALTVEELKKCWSATRDILDFNMKSSLLSVKDTMAPWRALVVEINRLASLNDTSLVAPTREFFRKTSVQGKRNKTRELGLLGFSSSMQRFEDQDWKLLDGCKDYFDRYFTSRDCHRQMLSHVSSLEPPEMFQFREYSNKYTKDFARKAGLPEDRQLQWIIAECNVLEFDFSLLHSRLRIPMTEDQSRTITQKFCKLVCNCIRLYQLSRCHTVKLPRTDVDPGNAACILAANALADLYNVVGVQAHLVQAALLLQFVTRDAEYDSVIRGKLITVLQHLGLHSVALDHWHKLNVKEILYESTGPLFLARIGSLHPEQSGKMELYAIIKKGLDFYEKSMKRLPKFQQQALALENYNSVAEFEELRQALRKSLVRRLLIYERRRIARITGVPYNEDDQDMIAAYKTDPSDVHVPQPETVTRTLISSGLPFHKDYVEWLEVMDEAYSSALTSKSQISATPKQIEFDQNSQVYERINVLEDSNGLTETEKDVLINCRNVLALTSELRKSTGLNIDAIEWSLKTFQNSIVCNDVLATPEKQLHIWPFLSPHDIANVHLRIEYLQVVQKLMQKVLLAIKESPAKERKEILKRCEALVKDCQNLVQRAFSHVQKELKSADNRMSEAVKTEFTGDRESQSFFEATLGIGGKSDYAAISSHLCELMGEQTCRQIFNLFIGSHQTTLRNILALKL